MHEHMVIISNSSLPCTQIKAFAMSRTFHICSYIAPCRRPSAQRAAGVVALALLLVACGKGGDASVGPGMMPLPVTVIEMQPQRVPIVVEAAGQAEGSKEVQVRARVSGILTRQLYKEGDTVKAGTTLFTIDRVPYELAQAQARAALTQDQANVEKAQRDTARLKPLIEQRAISQKEYDDATSALKTSSASVLANEARLREADLNLSYTNVTAPITGVTGRALQSVGSLVTTGSDAGLLTTINITDPIWVSFSFSENEVLQLRRAAGKTGVTLLLPDGSTYARTGTLNFAASSVDMKTGAVPLRAAFPNPALELLPGQFVRVQVTVGQREAYLVPQAALSQSDQGKVVFTVAADNTVSPRPVETAGWSGHDWVVTKGLAPGDKVIVDNLMKLRPGAPVAPHAPAPVAGTPGPAAATGGTQGGATSPGAPKSSPAAAKTSSAP
jgi:membrane fusion protein (multidrug efflux system)